MVLAVLVTLSLLICGSLLVYGAGRGVDLTDEIFYLIWARDPDAHVLNYQPFGYLLHPLFELSRGDLHVYRLMGFAITAGAGAALGSALAPERRMRLLFCVYGAAAALTIFFPWIVTPSYNTAANDGALLMIAGVLTMMAGRSRYPVEGTVTTAAGLCIAAFSKPPLFAIAGIAIVGAAAITKDRRAKVALIATLPLAAALMTMFLTPQDMVGLIKRMALSQRVLALPNTPLSLPAKIARDWLIVPWPLSGAVVAASVSLITRASRWSQWSGYLAVGLSLFYVGSIAGAAIDGNIPDFIGLALVTLASGYTGLLWHRATVKMPALLVLLASPCAVALGTFNNQWAQLNFSMAFPFLALFMLATADQVRWRRGVAYTMTVAGPPLAMILAAGHPYSLPASIFDQRIMITHPLTHGPMLVDQETAAFVHGADGLATGQLLVDLSGTGPGVGAVLGARAPVLSWLNPATPTWPDVVWNRLTFKQRSRVWFVGPTWPLFATSAPAMWLDAHRSQYCRRGLPPMMFWGEDRRLELWAPCRNKSPDTNY